MLLPYRSRPESSHSHISVTGVGLKPVACHNSARSELFICVETDLISFGCVDAAQADLDSTNTHGVRIQNRGDAFDFCRKE